MVAAGVVALPTAAGAFPQDAAAPAAVSANSQTFNDSTGEDPAAPDISTIVVSNTDVGALTFKVNIPNRPQYGQDQVIFMFLDSDANQATGDSENLGADHIIEIFRGEVLLYKWDGADYALSATQSSLSYSWASGPTIRINASDLANTRKLSFDVTAVSGVVIDPNTGGIDCTNCKRDFAPAIGFFQYAVVLAKPTLVVKKVATSPRAPAAGKRFTLSMTTARSDTGAALRSGRVTCVGRVGKVRLKARVARVVNGVVTCTWLIPKKAKGKSFRGSAAIAFEGLTATRSHTARIR
jgi:hypothetical protein